MDAQDNNLPLFKVAYFTAPIFKILFTNQSVRKLQIIIYVLNIKCHYSLHILTEYVYFTENTIEPPKITEVIFLL